MVPRHRATVGSYGEGFSYERGTPVKGTSVPKSQEMRERARAGQCSRVSGADSPGPEGGSTEGGPFALCQGACRGCGGGGPRRLQG